MTVTTIRPWQINGTDLQTFATNIRSTDGWAQFPGKRGSNLFLPYKHGKQAIRSWYDTGRFSLGMVVLDTDSAGAVTHADGRFGHLQENLDNLIKLFHTGPSLLTIDKTLPDTTTIRRCLAEVVDAFSVDQSVGTHGKIFVVVFKLPHPFWKTLPINNQVVPVGTDVITNAGNAPISDMVFTFAGAGRITNNDSGDFIDISTSGVTVVDVGAATVTQGGNPFDAFLSINKPWWMEFQPGANNITVAGSQVTVDWYDAWFSG